MSTEKALIKGSECPPLEKGKLRHYSMRFCPFAQRSRLVLAHKKIPHETVNINLSDRPEWFTSKSAQGKVPCLEIDGRTLIESLIISEYLDEAYEPKNVVFSNDPWKKAEQKILIEQYSGIFGPYYGLLKGKDGHKEAAEKLVKFLHEFEKNLKGDFFGGDHVDAVDYMVWPWFERLGAVSELRADFFDFSATEFPVLTAWCARMAADEVVKATFFDQKTHAAVYRGLLNDKLEYDYGL